MKLIGYLTFYIKVESADRDPSYCKFHCDFSKFLTRNKLNRLLKSVEKSMLELNVKPTKILLVTEEEYLNSDTEFVAGMDWKV